MKIWKKKRFWGGLIAVALLVYCVKDISLAELEKLAERLDLVYLLPAIASTYFFVFLKAMRWRVLISQNKHVSAWRVTSIFAAGQLLNIAMPALTGQVGRMILFARQAGLRRTFVFSTIVLEIVYDAIGLVTFLVLTSLYFAFPRDYRSLSMVISIVTVVAIILLYVILTFRARLEDYGRRRLRDRWPSTYIALKKTIRSFAKGIETMRSSQHVIKSLVYTLVLWMVHALVIYFLLRAFGYHLPLAAAASVMIINTLALMIPITPGNAGTFEVAVSTALTAFAVGRSDAVLFAVALHLLDLLPLATLGMAMLRSQRASLKKFEQEHGRRTILDEVSEDGILVEEGEGS
jgi:uncharacterized protein (TIRG00374 family)